jgi:hypothetical protein
MAPRPDQVFRCRNGEEHKITTEAAEKLVVSVLSSARPSTPGSARIVRGGRGPFHLKAGGR